MDCDGNGLLCEVIGVLSEWFVMLLCGCYVYYIEFGFELVKMIELMKVVSGGGLNYLCYMVVDINELLEDVMWYVIMLFLKMLGCFNYIVDDYWNV